MFSFKKKMPCDMQYYYTKKREKNTYHKLSSLCAHFVRKKKKCQDVDTNVFKMWVAHLVMHEIPIRMNWLHG